MIQTITNTNDSFKLSHEASFKVKKIRLELKKEDPDCNFLFYLISGSKYNYSIL